MAPSSLGKEKGRRGKKGARESGEGRQTGRQGRQVRDSSAFYFTTTYLTFNGSMHSFLLIFLL